MFVCKLYYKRKIQSYSSISKFGNALLASESSRDGSVIVITVVLMKWQDKVVCLS